MRLLPRLLQGSLAWRLPLADCSAIALEAVLLAPGDRDPPEGLAPLLASDPALALWTVCQAHLDKAVAPMTSVAAAEWLAPRLISLFDAWDAGDDAPQVPKALHRCYAHLAAAGVVHAHIARQPAEATLAALLHGADEWLALAAAESVPAEQVSACLPDWLAKQKPATATDPHESDKNAPGELHQEVVRRWMTDDEDIAWRLPALVAKLSSLQPTAAALEARLEHEKLESVKELAYGAGHEINNPLANISARAQMLLRDETHPERRHLLAAINSQAFRAHEMIADLMLIARPPKLAPERVELDTLVDEVTGQVAAEAERRGTTIACGHPADPVFAEADPVQLGVVLSALCNNALEALGSGGHIQLEVRYSGEASGDVWAEIVVADDGPGIGPEVRRHLFDPFYSGREAGRGLGFGLAKSWRIVTDHGGRIEVDSGPGRGATFTVRLPTAHSEVVSQAS